MSLVQARQWDQEDPLSSVRDAFCLPAQTIYMDGNSLGPLTHAAKQRASGVVDTQWGQDLITSWNKHQWIGLSETIGNKIAPIIGAQPDEVICCDSTSINLFKLLTAALSLRPGRTRIVSEKGNFPTDLYMVQGIQSWCGDKVQLDLVSLEEIPDKLGEDVAVVMLTQVDFRSGRLADMAAITAATQAAGAISLWDLAHSAGALPVNLNQCNVDMAVGCGYKYLNGGPGAPAFCYVAKRHHGALTQPLTGWMGHSQPFAFDPEYTPAAGMRSLLVGTPPVLSMSVLDAALNVFSNIPMSQIRDKSVALSQAMIDWFDTDPRLSCLTLVTPREASQRGSQLAWRHPHAYQLCQALIAEGIIADFRAPDILRFGLTPLYLRFVDVWQAKEQLADIIETQRWQRPEFAVKNKVT